MADKISERREKANNFFLLLNGGICTIGIPLLDKYSAFLEKWQLLILFLIVLLAIAYYWYQIIKSYKKLNGAKFQIIEEFEEKLPARPYGKAEWRYLLREGKEKCVYSPLTDIETKIPLFFSGLYVILFVIQMSLSEFKELLF